jgi:DNA-binding transcriptional MerR regulator
MLIRISLIIAIVLCLGVAGLNFFQVKDKIQTTISERDQFHKTADEETAAHRKFQKLAADTQTKLDKTTQELNTAKTERDQAVAQAADAEKRADTAVAEEKKVEGERDDAQNQLAAWKALGIPIENMKATLASLKTVSEERDTVAAENKILNAQVTKLQNKINTLINADYEVPLPVGLKGKVLVADPRYDFVVLDIGENQGVLEDGKMLVNRNGKLIAKVKIKSVQADRCIANVMPGWKQADIMEGDQVLY